MTLFFFFTCSLPKLNKLIVNIHTIYLKWFRLYFNCVLAFNAISDTTNTFHKCINYILKRLLVIYCVPVV